MKDNIILIGFMGAGKGCTARALAAATGLFTVDTDDLIESFACCSIRTLFATRGESVFRGLEQQVADWLERSVDHTVVSTGGGFFMVRNLAALGHIFFLDADFDHIYQRLSIQDNGSELDKRPLFHDPDQARQRYHERLPLYRQHAHHRIDANNKSSSAIALEIRDILRSRGMALPFVP